MLTCGRVLEVVCEGPGCRSTTTGLIRWKGLLRISRPF